jgi:hypothetical protein
MKQHEQPKRFLSVWGNNFVSEWLLPLHEEKQQNVDKETYQI